MVRVVHPAYSSNGDGYKKIISLENKTCWHAYFQGQLQVKVNNAGIVKSRHPGEKRGPVLYN